MEVTNPSYSNFQFEQIYHLYTRVSGNESVFRHQKNYDYFLSQFSKYLLPYLDVFAYCLVPQRFSFLVCFKSKNEILENLGNDDQVFTKEEEHKFLMKPLSNLLNSYAKAYNKMYNRKGALFMDYVRRENIDDDETLKNTFREIHKIPMLNQLTTNIEDWIHSSYHAYKNPEKPTKISRQLMMDYFDDIEDFVKFHQ
ncbi:MAG: hypothetical protein BGO40_10515 [Chryseobacterium sp. 39-10]|nr:transposase [Chryseobacterium sp.]OJV49638.1 MAG: hypothetical protein BGO40_10515 [Chryseobacterium sp. 39-10]